MKIHPYLNFPGTAEEAMNFYAKALSGKLTEVHRFSSMPGAEQHSEATRQRVMHVGLMLPDGFMIMASDTMEGMGPYIVGTNVTVSIHPSSREEADRVFSALAEGGQISMPLSDQFWGDYYGSLTDRFGIQWMINFNAAANQTS
jgi:PhnB protein